MSDFDNIYNTDKIKMLLTHLPYEDKILLLDIIKETIIATLDLAESKVKLTFANEEG